MDEPHYTTRLKKYPKYVSEEETSSRTVHVPMPQLKDVYFIKNIITMNINKALNPSYAALSQ